MTKSFYRLLSLTLLLVAGRLSAAELRESDAAKMLERAKLMQKSFDDGDADTIVRYTHPVILQAFSSKKEFVETTREALKAMAGKIVVQEVNWGSPSRIYMSGNQELSFLPKTTLLRFGQQRCKSVSFLIAARERGTTEWFFLDGAAMLKKPETLWELFPDLPKDLQMPANTIEVLP